MTPTKILYILSNEPTGGIGSFVLNFTRHFDEKVQIDYLIYTDQRNTDFQKKINTGKNTIYYLPELSIKEYSKLKRKTGEFFCAHAQDYQIVHLTYPGILNLCFPAAKKYGIPHRMIHSQNTRLSDHPLKSVRNKILCLNWKQLANHYLACSREAAVYLYGNQMVNDNKVTYIHNAIDCSQFIFNPEVRNETRKKYSVTDLTTILAVGRLENQKNIGFAIRVFDEIHKLKKNTVLLIAGDGPLRGDLEKQVSENGLTESVRFIGFTDQLSQLMNASDLLLLPSLYEGLPITAVDAQCTGLPCLLADTISPETKLTDLVQFESLERSPEIWAENAIDMLELDRRDCSKEIAGAGYSIVEESKKLEDYYLKIANE